MSLRAPGRDAGKDNGHDAGRDGTAVGVGRAALLVGLVPGVVGADVAYPATGAGVLLLVAAGLVVGAGLLTRQRPVGELGRRATPYLALLLVGSGVLADVPQLARTLTWPVAGAGGVVVLALVLLGGRAGRAGLAATCTAVALLAVALAVAVTRSPNLIDVLEFEHDAAARLLHGGDPWSMTFHNVYAAHPEASDTFYSPKVLSADGSRVLVGFPYPPVALLAVVPGYLLGDVRFTVVAALAVTALVLRALARDTVGRWIAPLVLAMPATAVITFNGWTEPVMIVLLAGLVLALARTGPGRAGSTGRTGYAAAHLLGALLVAKQYTVVALPLLWLLRERLRDRAFTLRVLGTALVLTLPFFLWDPAGFWRSVVSFQFMQPFRDDAVSLLVWSVTRFGWPPTSVAGVLPLAAGFVVAMVLARRAPATPAGFAAALGLTLLVTVLLSKQAFPNYYFMVMAAFAVAVVAWPAPAPEDGGPDTAVPEDPRAIPGRSGQEPSG